MYNNPYYASQNTVQKIDAQIAELERIKSQIPQASMQQPITQNFQITPATQNGIKYVSSVEDVNKEVVFCDTPFFNKDMSNVWVKNTKGMTKSYKLTEIIEKDEKDLQIERLMENNNALMIEIDNLKKEIIRNEQSNASNDVKQFENKKSSTSKSSNRDDK